MDKGILNKIHIIGSVGSGKTTLSRKLSATYDVPYYEIDNVVWERREGCDRRRTDEEKVKLMDEITSSDKWIIEGVHSLSWVQKSFESADVILFLDPPYSVRVQRIIKRFLRQKLGLEKANYTPTLYMFRKMFRWNAMFEKESKPKVLTMFSEKKLDFVVIKDNRDIDQILREKELPTKGRALS